MINSDNLYRCEILNTKYLTDDDYLIAESNGISKKRAYERFYIENWEKQRAIKQPIKKQVSFKKTVLEMYPNLYEILDSLDITYQAFYYRLRHGMTIEKALTTPRINPITLISRKRKKKGKISEEDIKIAADNGIKEGTFKNRVYMLKWSVERARTEPINKSTWNTKYYPKNREVKNGR